MSNKTGQPRSSLHVYKAALPIVPFPVGLTQIVFDTVTYDYLNEYSVATNTFIARYGGRYLISAEFRVTPPLAIVDGELTVDMPGFGTIANDRHWFGNAVFASPQTFSACVVYQLIPGDDIQVWFNHNHGAGMNGSNFIYATYLSIARLSD